MDLEADLVGNLYETKQEANRARSQNVSADGGRRNLLIMEEDDLKIMT